jgi:hypothetical protein
MIVDPNLTDYTTWFYQLHIDVPEIDVSMAPSDEKDWRNVAEILLQNPFCGKIGCPSTAGFNDWRSWATNFVNCVGSSV